MELRELIVIAFDVFQKSEGHVFHDILAGSGFRLGLEGRDNKGRSRELVHGLILKFETLHFLRCQSVFCSFQGKELAGIPVVESEDSGIRSSVNQL